MKKIAAIVLLSFLRIASLYAQSNSDDNAEQAYQAALKAYDAAVLQLERSNVRSEKRAIIKKSISLNTEQSQNFWPIYNKYEASVVKLNDQRLALIMDYVNHREDLGGEKATELINSAMQLQQQKQELKRAYVTDLGKVLTAKQALRLLLLENQFDVEIEAQIAAQIPL
jgi:Spy/CpxP family protein refolding chaperone